MNPSIRHRICSMSNEDINTLLNLAKRHLQLVKEHGNINVTANA
jgi:hypothetical protein